MSLVKCSYHIIYDNNDEDPFVGWILLQNNICMEWTSLLDEIPFVKGNLLYSLLTSILSGVVLEKDTVSSLKSLYFIEFWLL